MLKKVVAPLLVGGVVGLVVYANYPRDHVVIKKVEHFSASDASAWNDRVKKQNPLVK